MSFQEKFGLIAGNGRFPFLVLEGARAEGVEMAVAAIKEETDASIEPLARVVEWISVGHLDKLEGTDATIRRASELVKGRPLTVIKVAKPNQDMRFDVPVIGLNTMATLKECNVTAMSVTADKTLIFDRGETLALANQHKISIVGR